MRFIASDSTTLGEYLDGGSLVEAALDDIILYDLGSGDDVGETGDVPAVHVLPNPASLEATLRGWMPGSSIRVHDLQGREVALCRTNGAGQVRLTCRLGQWGVQRLRLGWPRRTGPSAVGVCAEAQTPSTASRLIQPTVPLSSSSSRHPSVSCSKHAAAPSCS